MRKGALLLPSQWLQQTARQLGVPFLRQKVPTVLPRPEQMLMSAGIGGGGGKEMGWTTRAIPSWSAAQDPTPSSVVHPSSLL